MAKSRTIILFLLISVFVSSSVFAADKWIKEDITREAVFVGLQIVDWQQTRYIAKSDEFTEINPILGKYPSRSEVNAYFAFTTLGHIAVTHVLPQRHRKYWQYAWIGLQAFTVGRNATIGVRFDW